MCRPGLPAAATLYYQIQVSRRHPWLSPQINTAKRILEKGKEEPERSWFQTKEEKKKEKGMSGRVFRKLNIEFIGPSNPSPRSIPRRTENGGLRWILVR